MQWRYNSQWLAHVARKQKCDTDKFYKYFNIAGVNSIKQFYQYKTGLSVT